MHKSAKDGTFHVGKLTPGVWLCVIWHPGYMPPGVSGVLASLANKTELGNSPFMLDVPASASGVIKKTYEMSRGRVIRGRVIDAKGKGISDIEIRYRLPESMEDELPYGMTTSLQRITATCPPRIGEDGTFALGCIPERLRGIRISAFRKGCACKYESVDENQEVVLRILPCASVEGRVTDLDGNAAIGAFVDLWSKAATSVDNWSYEEVEGTKTDTSGYYSLSGLPPTDCLISAGWMEWYCETSRWIEAMGPNETRRGIDLALGTRPRPIRARVVGPDGKPSPNAFVWVRSDASDQRDASGWDDSDEEDDGTTQASGRIEFLTRLPDPLEFVHETRDAVHVLKHIATMPDGERQLVTPATMHTIDIHVRTKSGAAMRSFEAHIDQVASGREYLVSVTGREGKASTRRYEKPPFSIRVHHAIGSDGALYRPEARVVDAKDLQKPLEFVLTPSGPRRIRILDSRDQPLPGANVSIHTQHWNETPDATVTSIKPDSDHAFPVPVPRDDPYSDSTLVISLPDGYVPVRARYDKRSYYEPIVPTRAGEIGGRVIFPESLSLPRPMSLEARWRLKRSDPPWLHYKVKIPVDERTGAFHSHRIPLDRPIELVPDPTSLENLHLVPPPEIAVRAGKMDVELRLTLGATIRGHVTSSGHSGPMIAFATPMQGASRGALTEVQKDGTFVLEGVPTVPHWVIVANTTPHIRYGEAVVAGGEDVQFDIGPLDVLRIHGTAHNGMYVWIWKTNSTRLLGGLFETIDDNSQIVAAVPTRFRYDVVLVAGNAIGYKLGVQAGESIKLSTSPGVYIAGEVDREPRAHERLISIPRRPGPKFALDIEGRSFFAPVLPGQYDIAYQPFGGALITIAKNVRAGARGLQLRLPVLKSRAK